MTDTLPMPIPAPLTPAQRSSILNLIRRAARAEILPRFRALSRAEIDTKSGPQDLVTEADRAAERMIARGLVQMFPNALIVGEEDVAANPEVVDQIAHAEMAFTIDPVDGTWNYAHGLTTFGVILSMTRYGQPVFGLLYDPVMDDAIVADREGPAQMLRPRLPAKTLTTSTGGSAETLSGYVPLYNAPKKRRPALADTFTRFARVMNLRCACHEFRMVAQGHADFILSTFLTPWDHAAGALIVARAGGHVSMLDGSEYRADRRKGYLLCAANAETWARVRDVFGFLLDDE
ncbi:inositol monophosphatase [Aestuariicoccus sp. MJ-SS9]|uniref:inositol monophosphatase family protein n=1 Tax=Aestuariicoccus sp. MJ-SS9 TaxID=3079855 RepID=UPI00290F25E1|nr:inositol monophosphatase [Aestuariicoccus sp. MJ-SS9]MDU8909936.1 inositol monophosphatase [Aestuariicoccus sp. MJ-SS9]